MEEKDNEKFSLQWNRNFNDNLSNTVSLYRNNNKLRDNGIEVGTGIFGADMKVSLINDGPVTILLEK